MLVQRSSSTIRSTFVSIFDLSNRTFANKTNNSFFFIRISIHRTNRNLDSFQDNCEFVVHLLEFVRHSAITFEQLRNPKDLFQQENFSNKNIFSIRNFTFSVKFQFTKSGSTSDMCFDSLTQIVRNRWIE